MLDVVEMHRDSVKRIHSSCPDYLREAAQRCGDEAVELGRRYGYRNSPSHVLAPTGTIAVHDGCDTTGVEPDIALVKYKLLAGGGMLKDASSNSTDGAEETRLHRLADRRDREVHR